MNGTLVAMAAALLVLGAPLLAAPAPVPDDTAEWTVYVANDNCPDYTWGLTEQETRKAFADIVKGHLDEMNRTDAEKPENQDRYNMAVTQEALCFVERYPARKDELIKRIKEGRVFVSPFLCNSLWGFQSVEGAVRTFYPARRLERDWGIPIDVAEHIEEPSMPWGMATILAGCGIRWLSNPFYAYDSTFGDLRCPPLFLWEGPDGSRVRVVMDRWASGKWSYTQGAAVLRDSGLLVKEWLPRFRSLGATYPVKAILASGTHGDIGPGSGGQARGFADGIIRYNAQDDPHPKLVNAALPQFCKAVDAVQDKSPFLPVVRGCFGQAWDLWPVCLAKTVADMRENERMFLAAEALLASTTLKAPEVRVEMKPDLQRAEWCLAMLADHAWNGTDARNKRHNADLRRGWSQELGRLAQKIQDRAWVALGIEPSNQDVLLFNPLSVSRREVVRIEAPVGNADVISGHSAVSSQIVEEDGGRYVYFAPHTMPPFSLAPYELRPTTAEPPAKSKYLRAAETELESPYYKLAVDPKTGGLASLVHKATKGDLVQKKAGRSFCQTVYFDGREHTLRDVKSEVVAEGAVLARLRITGNTEGMYVTTFVTVYERMDRVDFDVRIQKPAADREERLCHVFPVMGDRADLRVETTGAVIRPHVQPQGNLVQGADTRRLAVQGFVDVSTPGGPGVTIAPLDAFALRLDLGQVTFEALGNDQNYREVVQDQGGVTQFRFRYAVRGYEGPYNGPDAFAWSRAAAYPFLTVRAQLGKRSSGGAYITLDPKRAIATCLKPADGDAALGLIMRIWETADRPGPTTIGVSGFKEAWRTDLLERDVGQQLPIQKGEVTVDLPARGLTSLRLVR